MAHERLDAYLRRLAERTGDAALILKPGAPPRIRDDREVENLASETLDRVELSGIAGAIAPPEVAQLLVERRHAEFGYGVDGVGRFRTTAYSQRGSLALLFRRVLLAGTVQESRDLPDGMAALADERHGLVVVTGPADSGCTTTLHGMIDRVNRTRSASIATVEEPVEVLHKDILAVVSQLEVGLDAQSAGDGLRRAVRYGADVVMVDATVDRDAVEGCLAAAEAGRLVLLGLQAGQADDWIELFSSHFAPHEHERVRLRLSGVIAGLVVQRLVAPRGSGERVPATEVLVPTTAMRAAVIDGATSDELRRSALDGRRPGTRTLEEALVHLCESGVIDLRTAMTWAPRWQELRLLLEQRGFDTAGSS